MRQRLLTAREDSEFLTHAASKRGFFVSLMGPYKSYPPYESPPVDEFDGYDELYHAIRAHLRALA